MSGLSWIVFASFFLLCYTPVTSSSSSSLYKNNTSRHLCVQGDRSALLQLKADLNLQNAWVEENDCCGWEGVRCNPLTGHVIQLAASPRPFSFTFSFMGGRPISPNSSLFLLRHLEVLDLSNSFITSSLPSNISALSHLTYLNLSSNSIDGEIPIEIGKLSRLTSLDLSLNDINSSLPSNISALSHLSYLDLSSNMIDGEISNITALSHLRYLDLSSNMIDGEIPIEISQLSRLTSLDLSSNFDLKISDLDKIVPNMTLLRELRLSGVSINSSFPDSLTNLSLLVFLDLSGCRLKGNLPVYIGNLPKLQFLDLSLNTLSANFTTFHWSSPFRTLDLGDCNLTGSLTYLFGPTHSLEELRLDGNCFYGYIPSWALNISSYIDLSNNKFGGGLPLSVDQNRISGLTQLHLSGNSLSGELPSWLYASTSLTDVDISRNQFSGQIHEFASDSLRTIDFSNNVFSGKVDLSSFTNRRNLSFFYLSNSGLSVVATTKNDDNLNSCSLTEVALSSCNISIFPQVLRSCALFYLDLSKNSLGGEIPLWLREMSILFKLNLSYNHLVGDLGNVPQSVGVLDIRSNMLGPDFGIRGFAMEYFDASNNQLSGEIPSSCGNTTVLQVLDLSNNSLHGRFPTCLASSGELTVLNLRSNQLHGVLPSNFSDCGLLKVLDLNGNRLEGPIPQSLARCQSMEFLDLGNNMFNHSFPYWLESLPELQLLVLRNNNFHGVITASEAKHPFPKLRIADFSENNFCGPLPRRYIENFKGMQHADDSLQYMIQSAVSVDGNGLQDVLVSNELYYRDSTVLNYKNLNLQYHQILTTFASLDLSCNRFDGEIPESIGNLILLLGLNLSHNHLTGSIPPSVGNLTGLESLDLSSNLLSGDIPQQLSSLSFLSCLNVSENHLVGRIPRGKQLDTFQNNSYLGNPGLCGFPLPDCGEHSASTSPSTSSAPSMQDGHKDTELYEWEAVLLGYGTGIFFGFVGGYYLYLLGKPIWLMRLIYKAEFMLMEQKQMHARRYQRKKSTGRNG